MGIEERERERESREGEMVEGTAVEDKRTRDGGDGGESWWY